MRLTDARTRFPRLLRQGAWMALRIWLLLVALLYAGQDLLVLRPFQQEGLPSFTRASPHAEPWEVERQVEGLVVEPVGRPVKGTVIFFHGNAGSAEGREYAANEIAEQGYRAVLVEYPGFGQREGRATMANAREASLVAFDAARSQWPGPYIVAGESFGAGIAAQVAKTDPADISKLVLIVPWDSLANVTHDKLPFIPTSLLLKDRFDSVQALSAFRKPVYIVAAEKDRIIPATHARALARSIPQAQFTTLRGAGHNDWQIRVDAHLWAEMLKF